MMKNTIALTCLLFFLSSIVIAQDTESTEAPIDLNSQYQQFKENSETFNDYKVMKETTLDTFWGGVSDSINNYKKTELENVAIIDQQAQEITLLNAEADKNAQKFEENEIAATHISFLGIDFAKGAFIILFLTIVGLLSAVIAVGYIGYKQNRDNADRKLREFHKVQDELDEVRKKALEKQIQLKRELQTERNLVEELKTKSTMRKKLSA